MRKGSNFTICSNRRVFDLTIDYRRVVANLTFVNLRAKNFALVPTSQSHKIAFGPMVASPLNLTFLITQLDLFIYVILLIFHLVFMYSNAQNFVNTQNALVFHKKRYVKQHISLRINSTCNTCCAKSCILFNG